MGGSSSKTTAELLNEVAITATQRTISSCVSHATQEQLLSVLNVSGNVTMTGITMSQGASVDMQCIMSAQMQSDIQSNIASEIAQFASSQSEAFIGVLGESEAEATVYVKNALSIGVVQEAIQSEFNSALQKQTANFINIDGNLVVSDVTIAQTMEMTARTLITGTSYSSVISDIAEKVDQETAATQTNPVSEWIDSIGSIFSTWIWLIIGIALIGGVILIVFVVYFFKSGAATTLTSAAAQRIAR